MPDDELKTSIVDFVTPDLLQRLWNALTADKFEAKFDWEDICNDEWVFRNQMEDVLSYCDGRIARAGIGLDDILQLAGGRWEDVTKRPSSPFDNCSVSAALRLADATAILVLMERLGFDVHPALACDLVKKHTAEESYLTLNEVDVLNHLKLRHRTPPIELRVPERYDEVREEILRFVTGYEGVLTFGEDDQPIKLLVASPKYRARPAPFSVTCEECGGQYTRHSPSSEREHRKEHRHRLKVLAPEPNKRMIAALESDVDAYWVYWHSPKWKQTLIRDIAVQLKRDFHYDFVQWPEPGNSHRHDSVARMLVSDEGAVVGAAVFHPDATTDRQWRMLWIWISPGWRRKGVLTALWDEFVERFGRFSVDEPHSDAMKAFLSKKLGPTPA